MDFQTKRTQEENQGGIVNEGSKLDMTYLEYNRHKGSDGFSRGTSESKLGIKIKRDGESLL